MRQTDDRQTKDTCAASILRL